MLALYEVFRAGYIFLRLISTAILVYCVMSWFRPDFKAFYWLQGFLQPFLTPFRKLAYWVARRFNVPLDFTCLFAILGIQLAERLWWRLYALLARGL